jgi:hypothetical protein
MPKTKLELIDTFYAPLSRHPSSWNLPPRAGVLIIIPAKEDTDEATALFGKMFGHLQKQLNDEAAILPWKEEGIRPYTALTQRIAVRMLILSGLTAQEIGLQSLLPLHTAVRINNLWLLRTDAPAQLASASKDHKAAFWNAFKSTYEKI